VFLKEIIKVSPFCLGDVFISNQQEDAEVGDFSSLDDGKDGTLHMEEDVKDVEIDANAEDSSSVSSEEYQPKRKAFLQAIKEVDYWIQNLKLFLTSSIYCL